MSGGKDLYSAWLWDEMTEKPTSVFDGTYDECIAYIKVVYKRRNEYEKDLAARYDEIPSRLIGPYPPYGSTAVHRSAAPT